MSADNWRTCPSCFVSQADRVQAVKAMYGKILLEEYEERLATAIAPLENEDSLREDYDIGIVGEGGPQDSTFHVDYRAACTKCGFRYAYGYTADNLKVSK